MPDAAFRFLLGTWALEREIQGQAKMMGLVEISEIGDGAAIYRERVAVTMSDGSEFAGSQVYLIRRMTEGFELRFAETDTLFQKLRFTRDETRLRATALHSCGEDRYASKCVLGPGRSFSIQHTVLGPRKRYVSVTHLREATRLSTTEDIRGFQEPKEVLATSGGDQKAGEYR